MNIYQLLEAILEELADGRQEGESITDYKKRKANELEQHFADQARDAHRKAKAAANQAKQAKVEYKQNPNAETVQNMLDKTTDAFGKSIEANKAERKENQVKLLKVKMNAKEEEVSEDINSAIDKKYPEGSAKNKELKDKAAQAQRDADDAAAEHELGKRPEGEKVSGGWDIRDLHIPIETPEQVEYDRKAVDRDIKNVKKQWTKNKVGDFETRKKQFPKSYDTVGVLGEPDKKELETEKAARKALGKRKAKMNKNEALELMENIVKTVTKKYGEPFSDKTSSRGKQLHQQVVANDVNEIIAAAKRNLPDDKKDSMFAIDNEYNRIQNKRISNKDKVGQAKTDARRPGSLHDQMQEIKNRKEDAAKGYPKAIEKSIKRHDKKVNEALEIMEEILNVVESSKEELVNKYVPNMKAERRHLDKEVKKGKALAKGLEKSANFSGEMKEKAQQDYDKAQDKEWGAQYDVTRTEYGTPEHNAARVKYNKARQELKGANKELKDWTRDEYVTREKAGSVKKEAKEANKKRNDLNKKIAALKGRSDVVTDKAFEALEIMEQICDFADNLFELDYEEKQNISPNKISRVKKDKDGEKVEVVSVADELFPYSGSAKEQFNQKVLAKINDMIEGTGSLEDLIQFVRRGVTAKKSANEGYEGALSLLEDIEGQIKKRYGLSRGDAHEYGELGYNRANDLYGKVMRAKSSLEDKDQGTKHTETKNSKGAEKNEDEFYAKVMKRPAQIDHLVNQIPLKSSVQKSKDRHYKKVIKDGVRSINKNEAYDEIIGFLSDLLAEAKDPVYSNIVSKELRGEKAIRDQHSDDMVKYADRADKATGYRKQVNLERAADADKAATEASKKFRKHKGEVLDYFRKKGDNNVEAHKKLSRMMGAYEALDVIESIIKEIISEEENWEPAKYKNKWHVYDKTSCTYSAVKGGKKGAEKKAKELNTAYPEQKAKVDPFYEALDTIEEIKNVAEGLFKKDERGDLLDDIDTALGSPVKKTVKDIEDRMTGATQKKVSENLSDQINKKFKKGEISLDKAFELDKKVEDNMSKEKNAQEYADELDKRAKKERLGDKAVAKSIRRNEKK